MDMIRSIVGALSSLLLVQSFALSAELPAPVRGFIEKHCSECHNADSKSGGLDLAGLGADLSDPAVFQRWVKIHDRVRSGEMPPPEAAAPPAKDREAMVKGLSDLLFAADNARQRKEGRVPLRRLNRTE